MAGVRGSLCGLGATALVLVIVFTLGASPPATGSRRAMRVQELVGLRTATSETFRNPDGTLTASLYSEPVHYWTGGRWADIDDTLVADSGAYARVNAANRFRAHFKPALGDDDFLKLDV